MFYATPAVKRTGLGRIWTVASLVLPASLLVHGFSATPRPGRIPPDTATEKT